MIINQTNSLNGRDREWFRTRLLAGLCALLLIAAMPIRPVHAAATGRYRRQDAKNAALFAAIEIGSVTDARRALAAGANVNAKLDLGERPLTEAIRMGEVDIVKLLLTHLANPNLTGLGGETPLVAAIDGDELDIVKLLLAHRAIPNQTGWESPVYNALQCMAEAQTAGNTASYRTRAAMLRYLLGHGADINARTVDSGGMTTLEFVAGAGQLDMVRIALEYGAKVNELDFLGMTPLMASLTGGLRSRKLLGRDIILSPSSGGLPIVKCLVDAGANVNAIDASGETGLMIAAYEGETPTVKELLSAGANASVKDNTGRTALDWALQSKSSQKDAIVAALRGDGTSPATSSTGKPH